MASNVYELATLRHLLVSRFGKRSREGACFQSDVFPVWFQTDDGLERRVRGHLHAHKAFVDRLGCVCQLEVRSGSLFFSSSREKEREVRYWCSYLLPGRAITDASTVSSGTPMEGKKGILAT